MYSALLKNKWPLLAFLVITLAGVQLFVGEGSGLAPREPEQLALANVEPPPAASEPEPVIEDSPDLEGFYSGADAEESFVDDEELIDSAEGFDPTPVEDEEADDGAEEYFGQDEEEDVSGEPVP